MAETDKYFFPGENQEKPLFINIDEEAALILMLVLIIMKEKGDIMLILALLYILS